MTNSLYTGTGIERTEGPQDLPPSRHEQATDPKGYRADEGLVDAVNVALLINQPLLLTGEPGTGKTQLAKSVAAELGLDRPLRFDTKSTSTAKDLFYTFDAVGRFHASHTGKGRQRTVDYITYQALGKAILLANPREKVQHVLPTGFKHDGPCRMVVLIDEVDKAPRDFPNDILAELENMYFYVRELNNEKVEAGEGLRPVVIMTSNSEKQLPDAFLRRCVFYDIPFPKPERLKQILAARLEEIAASFRDSVLLDSVLNLFQELRNDAVGLRKKPATAELLGWLMALASLTEEVNRPVWERPELVRSTLSLLVKNREDQPRAHAAVTEWITKRKRG